MTKEANFEPTSRMQNASINEIKHLLLLGDKGLQVMEGSWADEGVHIREKAKDDALEKMMILLTQQKEKQCSDLQTKYSELQIQNKHLLEKANIEDNATKLSIQSEIEPILREEIKTQYLEQLQDKTSTCEEQKKLYTMSQGIISSQQTMIQDLQNANKLLEDKLSQIPKSNVAKGMFGEKKIQELIGEAYGGYCDFKVTSYDAHSMDLFVTHLDGFNCRIEAKFKVDISTNADVNKFKRDFQELIKSGDMKSGCFASLKGRIPLIPSGTIEMETNALGLKIPILYIHVTNEECFKHAMVLLKEIQKLCELEHSARGSEPMPDEVQKYHKEKKIFQQNLPAIFKDITEDESDTRQELACLVKCKELAEKRLQKFDLQRNIKRQLEDKIPWIFNEETSKLSAHAQEMEKAMDIYDKVYAKLPPGKRPKISDFGGDEYLITKLGLVKVGEASATRKRNNKSTGKKPVISDDKASDDKNKTDDKTPKSDEPNELQDNQVTVEMEASEVPLETTQSEVVPKEVVTEEPKSKKVRSK